MNRTFRTLLGLAICMIALIGCETPTSENEPEYDMDTWTVCTDDSNYHWHPVIVETMHSAYPMGIEKAKHDFGEDDSEHYCTKCGFLNPNYVESECEHTWDNGEVTTKPTCTKDGVKTFTCSKCTETKTETVAMLGHSYSVTDSKAADYNNNGYTTYTCSRCDDTYTDTIPKLSCTHSSTTKTVTKSSTCKEHGTETETCNECGCIVNTITLDLVDHTWKETSEATCTTANVMTCSVCGDTKSTVSAKGHTFSDTDTTTEKCGTCDEKNPNYAPTPTLTDTITIRSGYKVLVNNTSLKSGIEVKYDSTIIGYYYDYTDKSNNRFVIYWFSGETNYTVVYHEHDVHVYTDSKYIKVKDTTTNEIISATKK